METVNILIEALPYIKKFHKKKILIKYGGHSMIDERAMESTARDTVLLKYVGMEPIVVHGGGPEISRAMNKVGKDPEFIEGLRVTDKETMDIVKMVLVGKINTEIVSKICLHGGKGVGLSGKDSRLIEANKKAPHLIISNDTGKETMVDLGLVGEIKSINPDIIDVLTERDYIPIISPIGVDSNGEALNLNADTVAGDIASKMDTEKLIILTDVPGILEDPKDPDSILRKIRVDEIGDLIKNRIITEGMLPKTLSLIHI